MLKLNIANQISSAANNVLALGSTIHFQTSSKNEEKKEFEKN